jgi:hypothetical protein
MAARQEGAAMVTLMAALAGGMAVTGGTVAPAQNPEDGLTVTLHVTNYADMSPKELAAAEAYATAIYGAAGIQTVWADTPWAAGETRSQHLRVVILSNLGGLRASCRPRAGTITNRVAVTVLDARSRNIGEALSNKHWRAFLGHPHWFSAIRWRGHSINRRRVK